MSKKGRLQPIPAAKTPAVDTGKAWSTADSFQNFQARVGIGTGNQTDNSTYGFNFITRNRVLLEGMYRGSWIVGKGVDAVAEDMTRCGIKLKGSIKPEDMLTMAQAQARLQLWQSLCDGAKWSRLYGGSLVVQLIDGQNMATPLRTDTVGRGQLKGYLVLDRWLVQPSLNDLVQEFGPSFGMPKYYDVVADSLALKRQRIHYSRVVRFEGQKLPYWQRMSENMWGMSIVERLFDRMVAFDSTTLGIAQLVYKAHLRTLKVDQLRDMIASNGPAAAGLAKQIDFMRATQSNEGLTVLDKTDEFDTHTFTFTGLDDVLLQFGQQLSGALDIPLVRLFGQSPKGLNATGESDMEMYENKIGADQETALRNPLTGMLEVMCYSELGGIPKGFGFDFVPLSETTATEKAENAQKITQTVTEALDIGLVNQKTALMELRQSSEETGVWTNITDEDIAAADDAPPELAETGEQPDAFGSDAGQKEAKNDAKPGQGKEGRDAIRRVA